MTTPDLSFLPAEIADLVRSILDEPHDNVFDGDGTLWSCDVGEMLLERLDSKRELRKYPQGGAWSEYLKRHLADADASYEFSTSTLEGMTEREINYHVQDVVMEVLKRGFIYGPMEKLMSALHQAKQRVWVVSASNIWCVRAVASLLEIPKERVIAVNLMRETGDDRYSSTLVRPAPICRGKVDAIRSAGLEPALAVGNSIHDRHMLEFAAKAFMVTPEAVPNEPAVRMAVAHNWPILRV